MKVAILPHFKGEDQGDGGIRRVVEAQHRYLPEFGIETVGDGTVAGADLIAQHAGVHAYAPATIPLVSHCHGLYWAGYEWERWALQMNREVIRAMRRADVVTAPSKWVAHAIRRGSQIDPVVLYHGIEPEDWSAGENQGYVLWNKTRWDAICDPRDVHRLADRVPNQQFVTTIKWPLGNTPGNVHETGVLPYEVGKQLIRNAGVYLATTRETFGIGTLEAMACGVPVLGWDWGGQHEIVRHGETGWLAKPDDYGSLVEGLAFCLKHRADLGAAARETVLRDFTWRQAMERYSRLYRSLLDSPPAPKVSIVIPCHNLGHLLPDAVNSVIQQKFEDYEIIIVDDASTDDTPRQVDNLAMEGPQPIRVIHNEKNLYLAETLNVGISAARGRYILPLDADNMLGGPGVLGLLVEALDKDRDISIAYGSMSVIEPDGREWVSEWPPTNFDFRRQLKHQNQITSTAMYRKSIWQRVGGYRRRCPTAEDADFWCRATSFGANARKVTDAVVLRYRNREDSMSHVQQDWPWHEWYPWGKDPSLTPWIAPVDEETRFVPTINPHETPLVTVVIPVGPGHERLVLDALDSLNAQTFPWWEAIVVNDTGKSIPWVPAWCTVVSTGSQGARGAGHARNVGMRSARGRMFMFLDADDYLHPKALELMVNTHARVGGFVYTDWFKAEDGAVYNAPEWNGCDSVLHQLPWSVTCLYPYSAWADSGGYDEELPAWEDWDFAIRVVRAGYCGTRVAAPLFHYRLYTGSRRETGFAGREDLKQEIMERWRSYIQREVEMPCGCQGGGGSPSLPIDGFGYAAAQPTSEVAATNGEMMQLEFMEEVAAPLTYTGRVTGTNYSFGSEPHNKVRWVLKPDVEHFLTRGEFRPYNGVDSSEPLLAAGPPR